MTTIALVAQRTFSLFVPIVGAYRRWRFARLRHVCISCAVCGRKLDTDANRLLRQGHYRAAVFTARLQLENALWTLCEEAAVVNGLYRPAPKRRKLRFMIDFLADQERISKHAAQRVEIVYTSASRVVHGAPCPEWKARRIMGKVSESLRLLQSQE